MNLIIYYNETIQKSLHVIKNKKVIAIMFFLKKEEGCFNYL